MVTVFFQCIEANVGSIQQPLKELRKVLYALSEPLMHMALGQGARGRAEVGSSATDFVDEFIHCLSISRRYWAPLTAPLRPLSCRHRNSIVNAHRSAANWNSWEQWAPILGKVVGNYGLCVKKIFKSYFFNILEVATTSEVLSFLP